MRWDFTAIGTVWQIQTEEPLSAEDRTAVLDLVDGFDRDWSRFRDDSLVSTLARRGGSVTAPADTVAASEPVRSAMFWNIASRFAPVV